MVRFGGEHNGGSKATGEGGWDKHGSHRDQSGPSSIVYQIPPPPLSTHPKYTPAMSLMCEGMKTGRNLVICWEILPEG